MCGISDRVSGRLNSVSRDLLTDEQADFSDRRGECQPSKHISQQAASNALSFIDIYASTYSLPDTGRHPGSSSYDCKLMLESVFDAYRENCDKNS